MLSLCVLLGGCDRWSGFFFFFFRRDRALGGEAPNRELQANYLASGELQADYFELASQIALDFQVFSQPSFGRCRVRFPPLSF